MHACIPVHAHTHTYTHTHTHTHTHNTNAYTQRSQFGVEWTINDHNNCTTYKQNKNEKCLKHQTSNFGQNSESLVTISINSENIPCNSYLLSIKQVAAIHRNTLGPAYYIPETTDMTKRGKYVLC